jgi:flagellar basal-body rod protein FlgB
MQRHATCVTEGMSLDRIGEKTGNVLTWLARREEAIASNLANTDTPGYKTQDVENPGDFSSLLATSLSAQEVPNLVSRNDGNNVSLDREARLLAENNMKFNLATQLLRDELKNVRSAIEEGRSS